MKKKEIDTVQTLKALEEEIGMPLDEFVIRVTDTINSGIPLREIPWDEFVTLVELMHTIKHENIFIVLRDTLFQIPSYSKRISCISFIKQAAYLSASPMCIQDWEQACGVLTNYYSRLRELASKGLAITNKWANDAASMDELSFLFEHISADELIVLMQITSGFITPNKDIPQTGDTITYISRIFGMKPSADVGAYLMPTFCTRLQSVNTMRLAFTNGRHIDNPPVSAQLDISLRNQCFDIYIDQRIKIIRDDLLAADDTLPTIPSDIECLQQMLETDKVLYDRMEHTLDECMQMKDDSLEMIDKRLFENYSEEVIKKWTLAAFDIAPFALKMMKSFIRYEETKIAQLQKAESLNGARSMTFNGPVGQVIANVEEINTTTEK